MSHKLYILFLMTTSLLHAKCDPESYHVSNTGQFKYAIKEICKLNLSGTEKLLDIGSGDGRVSSYIAQEYITGGQLIGIDISSDMVIFAREHSNLAHVSFIVADACEYVVPHEYDVITSFWTLHWVKEYGLALKNIAQSLKPGGKALLCHIVGMDPFQIIVNDLLATEKWEAYKGKKSILFNAPSLLQIAHVLEESKLVIDSFEIKRNGEWLPVEIVKQNLLSLPSFDFIPSDARIEFCDDVLRAWINEYPVNEKNEMFQWLPVVVMVLKKPL